MKELIALHLLLSVLSVCSVVQLQFALAHSLDNAIVMPVRHAFLLRHWVAGKTRAGIFVKSVVKENRD
jgi:hypothetical protein